MPATSSEVDPVIGGTSVLGLLRDRGVRITASRVAVLTVVEERPHIDADTVASVVRSRLGSVSTQAIYDALALFTSLGLVRRIKPAGSSALYETRVGDNHHHLMCRGCGDIVNIDCPAEALPCLVPTQTHGFLIDEAEVTYWGQCHSCQSASA